MTDSPAAPRWTEHDVSDPGITLLQAVMFTVGTLVVATVSVRVLRRRRRAAV